MQLKKQSGKTGSEGFRPERIGNHLFRSAFGVFA
jgi:hypothetical protein